MIPEKLLSVRPGYTFISYLTGTRLADDHWLALSLRDTAL